MKSNIIILLLLGMVGISFGQEIKSKADKFFYAYAYEDAIAEYRREMSETVLSNHQFLNLADAYYKTGNYEEAAKIYLDINEKDTIISNHRFNQLLQSLSKTSEQERVKAFMRSKSASLSTELMENAEFNFELLATPNVEALEYNIFNLASNSPQADFSPAFYLKDKVLFASSRPQEDKDIYAPSGNSYMDIYVAKIGLGGRLLNPNTFTGIPESKFHEATPFYSKELGMVFYILSNAKGNRLIFDDKGKNSLALSLSGDYPTPDQSFRYLLRDPSRSFYYPFLDAESERLYFAADLGDGYGGTDLYYVSMNRDQIMSAPVNLGPWINSPGNEIAPFFFQGSLYFSSDIFYGLGGMDIYRSNLGQDNSFSIPVNLGSGINTPSDEFGFIISESETDGLFGYFASNRPGGKGNDDLYGFHVDSKPGLKTIVLQGRIFKNTGREQDLGKVAVRLSDTSGTTIKETYSDGSGAYRIEIPWRDAIVVSTQKEGYTNTQMTYEGEELEAMQQQPFDIGMAFFDDLIEEKEGKQVFKLDDFYFEKGKSDMTVEIANELDKVVRALQSFPELQVAVETHTDSRGSSWTNKKLSQARSEAVKKYIMQHGIREERIVAVQGFGEERILNNCVDGAYCLDFLHKQNERTLIEVIGRGETEPQGR